MWYRQYLLLACKDGVFSDAGKGQKMNWFSFF